MLIYYFSTEMMVFYGKEKRCNSAPLMAHYSIKMAVFQLRMSDRNTANKMYAILI